MTRKRSVLVTGATGFIGRRVVSNLLDDGIEVYALTRGHNKVSALLSDKIKFIIGDITQSLHIPDKVGTIYHCAGVISQEDIMEEVNVLGTKRVVEAALIHNCRLIHLSSAGIVGKSKETYIDETAACHPQNLYEQTKFDAEKIVLKNIARGLDSRILRPTIVIGSGRDPQEDSFLHLIRAIKSGHYKNINQGKGIYNIVHVDEVVRAMRIMDSADMNNGSVYFINSPISFRKLARIVRRETANDTDDTVSIPYFLAFSAALLFSSMSLLTGRRMPLTLSRLKALTNKTIFLQARLIKQTQYRPLYDIENYIKQVCQEYSESRLLN